MQGLAVAPRSQTADRRGVDIFALLKLRGYWTKFNKFLHNVATYRRGTCLNRKRDIPLRLGMPRRCNECESADFANFNPKIGCHGNVP